MASVRSCFPKMSFPDSGSPENVTLVPEVGVRVGLGLFHRPKRKMSSLWKDLVLCYSWQVLDLYVCPNLLDLFHSFLSVGFRYL